jgi:hypothetical protein
MCCLHCQQVNREGVRFCTVCGRSLALTQADRLQPTLHSFIIILHDQAMRQDIYQVRFAHLMGLLAVA